MRWFEEEGEVARAVNFRDVTHKARPDLSWARNGKASVRPANGGAQEALRAPRVPSELRTPVPQPEGPPESFVGATLAQEDDEEELSGLHPSMPQKDSMSEPMPPEVQDFQSLSIPPSERRTDTMIEDIVPRAEEEAVSAIHRAVEALAEAHAQQFEAVEQRLVDLALVVARRVIAREVSLDRSIVQALVREGVSALGERDRVTVRVGMFFADMKDQLQAQLTSGKIACEVVVDSSLSKTGCVLETDLGKVDESIETRLANMIETLSFESRRKRK